MNIPSPQYANKPLLRNELHDDPFLQFDQWFEDAINAKVFEPHAMTLATMDADGTPDARTVLLKGFSNDGFDFFTNYRSQKAQQIEQNPRVCLHFLWKSMMRQIRIKGVASKVDREESEAYFQSRPRESRLGAWASAQSDEVLSREALDASYEAVKAQFEGKTIPLPDFWGGYRVEAHCFEFWQGQVNRLHDRFLYTQEGLSWKTARLAP